MKKGILAVLCLVLAGSGAAERPPAGPPIADALKAAVGDSRQGNRARAVLRNEAAARAGELIAALKHADDEVRVSAAWALRFSADKKAIAPLVAALRDENFSVARAAAVSLKQFGAIEQPLRELMRDGDSAMRWRGMINVDYLVLADLMDDVADMAMNDPADFIRADAAWVLRHASGPKVAEALMKCLADVGARTRYQAGIGLQGKVAGELMKTGSATRQKAIQTLLWILATHRDRPYAISAAVDRLTSLVVTPLGTDPGRWRAFVDKVEGQR